MFSRMATGRDLEDYQRQEVIALGYSAEKIFGCETVRMCNHGQRSKEQLECSLCSQQHAWCVSITALAAQSEYSTGDSSGVLLF